MAEPATMSKKAGKSLAPTEYLREKLELLARDVQNIEIALRCVLPGGGLQRVENSTLDFLEKLEIWHYDELDVALYDGDYLSCVEAMVGVRNLDTLREEHPDYKAVQAMKLTILAACPLTAEMREKFTAINEKYCRRQKKREDENEPLKDCGCGRRQFCRKCRDEYVSEESSSGDDNTHELMPEFVALIESIPLVHEMITMFGGNPYKCVNACKCAKVDEE